METSTVTKGVGLLLLITFLAVAILVIGSMGAGTSGFWYGVNNPNATGQNCYAGGCFANGTISASVNIMESTVLPVIATVSVFMVFLFMVLIKQKR